MPVTLQQPAGVATDLLTNAALALDFKTSGVTDAVAAAEASYSEAADRGVPLLLGGQSQAGATAQFQAAELLKAHPKSATPFGFLTMNAGWATLSVDGLDIDAVTVPGVNFSKDYDPGVGPHALFANTIGRQIYIHPDGTGSSTPETTHSSMRCCTRRSISWKPSTTCPWRCLAADAGEDAGLHASRWPGLTRVPQCEASLRRAGEAATVAAMNSSSLRRIGGGPSSRAAALLSFPWPPRDTGRPSLFLDEF
ncbi:MAG: hypothetical protein WDN69_05895 [Aliidongia sp.]